MLRAFSMLEILPLTLYIDWVDMHHFDQIDQSHHYLRRFLTAFKSGKGGDMARTRTDPTGRLYGSARAQPQPRTGLC